MNRDTGDVSHGYPTHLTNAVTQHWEQETESQNYSASQSLQSEVNVYSLYGHGQDILHICTSVYISVNLDIAYICILRAFQDFIDHYY